MTPGPTAAALLVREARRARGLSAHQLAAAAGVGASTVYRLEHGRPATLASLDAVAGALGLRLALVE